jgi:ferric-dicitrate binding protein FerR (iron transport regulator)
MSPFSPPTPDDGLLARYVAGRATPDERLRVAAWLADDPAREATLDAMRRLWAVAPLDASATDSDVTRVWTAVRGRTIAAADSPAITRRPAPASSRRGFAMLVGAAAVGALAILFARPSTKPAAATPAQVYTTGNDQRAAITLADGSRITLAPRSKLTVRGDYARSARTVALSGEAYFDVAAHATPFTVESGSISSRVLGTRFVVSHYADDPDVRVAVASGKVSVVANSAKRPSVTLTAGTVGRVTDSTATAATVDDVSVYTDAVNGRMRFYATPGSDILRAFEHRYGYEIRLADSSLARGNYTTTFEGMTRADALLALKKLLNVSMTFDGNVLILRAAGTESPRDRSRDRNHDVGSTPREVGR